MKRVLLILLAGAIAIVVTLCYRQDWRHEVRVWLRAPTVNDAVQDLLPRRAVSFPSIPSNRIVILVIGQSNAGNYGLGRRGPTAGVYNFSHGKLFVARDPMLGSDSLGASPWVRFGEQALRSGQTDAVILALAVRGGTPIGEWRQSQPMYLLTLQTAMEMMHSNLEISYVFWQQGESDCPPFARTSETEYISAFGQLLAGLRNIGVKAPVYVAIATRGRDSSVCDPIRSAQRSLAASDPSILQGPDFDVLDRRSRYDGMHFSSDGLDKVASMWLEAITNRTR